MNSKRINANIGIGAVKVRNAGAKVVGCDFTVTDPSFSSSHSYHQSAARPPAQPSWLAAPLATAGGATGTGGGERRDTRRRLPMSMWSGSRLS